MTAHAPVQHTSFTIERKLATSPRHAFRFWSDAALKDRWNSDFLKPVSLGRRFGYNEAVCPLAMIMWSLRDSAVV